VENHRGSRLTVLRSNVIEIAALRNRPQNAEPTRPNAGFTAPRCCAYGRGSFQTQQLSFLPAALDCRSLMPSHRRWLHANSDCLLLLKLVPPHRVWLEAGLAAMNTPTVIGLRPARAATRPPPGRSFRVAVLASAIYGTETGCSSCRPRGNQSLAFETLFSALDLYPDAPARFTRTCPRCPTA